MKLEQDMRASVSEMEEDPPSSDSNQQYVMLTDNSMSASILAGMDTLRQAGQLCDCVLRVGKKSAEFTVHQAVLACISPYFMALFEQDPRTEIRKVYTVKCANAEATQILIDFAYSGYLKFTPESLVKVYSTAKHLKFNSAVSICASHMMDALNCTNCLDYRLCLADNSEFSSKINSFIQDHMSEIMETKSFLSLPQINVKLLGRDRGAEPEPATVAKLISDWLQSSSARIQDGDSVLTADGKTSRNGGCRTDSQVLTEHDNVLWLDDDNHIQDATCMDDSIAKTNVVQDYVKACRKYSKMSSLSAVSEHASNGNHRDSIKGHVEIIAHEKAQDSVYRLLLDIYGSIYHVAVRLQSISCNGSERRLSGSHQSGSSSRASNSDISSHAGSSTEDEEKTTEGIDQYFASSVSTYQPLANMTMARCGVGLAALDGQLIALGGNDRGECLSSVEAYDAQTNQWSQLPSMSCPRGRFECAVLDGKLYACGGSDGKREFNTVECFDDSTWSPGSKMIQAKSSAGVGVVGHKLYVIGGYNGQRAEKSCEVYDSSTKIWSAISKLHEGRSQAAVCSYKSLIYVFGGTDSWNCFDSVEVYNPTTDRWSYVAPMTQARRGAAAAVFRGKIYVVGGSDGSKSLSSVEIYDCDTNTWTVGPQLQTPRANAGLAVLSGSLYVCGGYGKNDFLSDLELLEGDGDSQWCSYVKHNKHQPVPDPDH